MSGWFVNQWQPSSQCCCWARGNSRNRLLRLLQRARWGQKVTPSHHTENATSEREMQVAGSCSSINVWALTGISRAQFASNNSTDRLSSATFSSFHQPTKPQRPRKSDHSTHSHICHNLLGRHGPSGAKCSRICYNSTTSSLHFRGPITALTGPLAADSRAYHSTAARMHSVAAAVEAAAAAAHRNSSRSTATCSRYTAAAAQYSVRPARSFRRC